MPKDSFVLIRGGGDLASGVALRLHRVGIKVVITELEQPLAVRRAVSFAEAVYAGNCQIEGVKAKLIKANQLSIKGDTDFIPVLIDPEVAILKTHPCPIVVDGRLIKSQPAPLPIPVPLHIGLGPGFTAGDNCHAVIETRRSHTLGRVYWEGSAQQDTGEPEGDQRRVLRATHDGKIRAHAQIGDMLNKDQLIAEIVSDDSTTKVTSPFSGVLRGLIHDGLHVKKNVKIGDVDPRGDVNTCYLISDKALSIGGGVLEAILTREEIRNDFF